MIGIVSLSACSGGDSFRGCKEYLERECAHFKDRFLQSAVIADGLAEEASLLGGQVQEYLIVLDRIDRREFKRFPV